MDDFNRLFDLDVCMRMSSSKGMIQMHEGEGVGERQNSVDTCPVLLSVLLLDEGVW